MKRAAAPGRSLGERFAGAFFGGLLGLPLGFAIAFVVLFALSENSLRYDIVGVTMLYSAAFTFVFGETLGDVIAGLLHLLDFATGPEPHVHLDGRVHGLPSGVRSILVFVLYCVALYFVLHFTIR